MLQPQLTHFHKIKKEKSKLMILIYSPSSTIFKGNALVTSWDWDWEMFGTSTRIFRLSKVKENFQTIFRMWLDYL